MFTWEFPPFISGGLGTACYGIVNSLLNQGVEVDLVLPTKEEIYFPLREQKDIDIMPVKFLDEERQAAFASKQFTSVSEKLMEVGELSPYETYYTPLNHTKLTWEEFISREPVPDTRETLKTFHTNLKMSDNNLFNKVYEMSLRAAKFAQVLNFDVIHSHDWLTAPAGVAAKTVSNKPLILHVHATEFDRAGGVGNEQIHQIEYAGMKYADLVLPVSNYTSQILMGRYRIDPQKIRVVHDALDITSNGNQNAKRVFRGPTILFLGRITIQKGPEYFLKVARQIIDRYPDVHFIMAGTGDMMKKIIHDSANYKFKNRFLFTGFLNKEQVEDIFLASDIFIMPSVSEPFGIAPLEAMGYGVVSVISKQSGVSEVIDNCFKIDFWDTEKMVETISYLLDNPEERKRIARAGKEEVVKIQWNNAVEKIRAIYHESVTTC